MEFEYSLKKLKENNLVKDYAFLATGDGLENSAKMAEYYSYTLKIPTLYFLLQNKKENVVKRMENISDILYINDNENLTDEEMIEIIKKETKEKNIGCVVIDYMRYTHPNNLMPMPPHKRFEIKHPFYNLANELNIKIFMQFYPTQVEDEKENEEN